MTSRSTRNKVRFQAFSALADLKRAEIHLGQLSAFAGERPGYIEENLPQIIAGLHLLIDTLDKFNEGL
jgi:hypothetical protein